MSISSEVAEGSGATRPTPPPYSGAHGFAPGSVVADRYRVISLLGRGGMGEVYGADDLKLGQRVALKFLPPDRLKNTSWRDQFYGEVRMARQVSHPNVCRVYDVGDSDGQLFLSMEFVDGEDLASLLRRIGRLPDDKAIEIAQQLCAGLAAAHRSGVLHRDLKPSNVMIDGKGRARITDFGLAIAASNADKERSPAGTPGYLAPELYEGQPPSVQSDLYALGLVLYELFTGKKAFEASSLAEFHRKQTETNPTPPSTVVKNLDPAVENAILRCLDRDPAQRPRSAMSVSAALPGGDPLAAALAAGNTPLPEVVAAAGPQGSLPPVVAWACLAAAVALLGVATYLARGCTDWGLEPMEKSPEVLADRAQELAKTLGYVEVVDRAFWFSAESDYLISIAHSSQHVSSRNDWKHKWRQPWPSQVAFWYRQSPKWMERAGFSLESTNVTPTDPPYEKSGMLTVKMDTRGRLLFLRAVPQQVEAGVPAREPDWAQLFAEAGLDRSRFKSAGPKWAPPDAFDSRADWEGSVAERPDVSLHVTGAAYHGAPVYFQVIAPWDQPWRASGASSKTSDEVSLAITTILLFGYVVAGGLVARWNLRRGRGDARGAMRFAFLVFFANSLASVLNSHFIRDSNYIGDLFMLVSLSLFPAFFVWLGYMAVEPYARRNWPKLLVSWQRLLNGRWRDPLVGREMLLGGLAGVAINALLMTVVPLADVSPINVNSSFGRGVLPSTGFCVQQMVNAFFGVMPVFALLAITTAMLRRRWLGLVATGLVLIAVTFPKNAMELSVALLLVLVCLTVLTKLGLVGAVIFFLVFQIFAGSPSFDISQWYTEGAAVALFFQLALVGCGFYLSLGGRLAGTSNRSEAERYLASG